MLYFSEATLKLVPFFLRGAILFPLRRFLLRFKPKIRHANASYTIISAVYNTSLYLDDFFQSIINQRLDFKNNIKIICVDDGSSDESASIIKKYQVRYPQNIVYLHKQNGGAASARNVGLDFLATHADFAGQWVSFVDSDDILDYEFFSVMDAFLRDFDKKMPLNLQNFAENSQNSLKNLQENSQNFFKKIQNFLNFSKNSRNFQKNSQSPLNSQKNSQDFSKTSQIFTKQKTLLKSQTPSLTMLSARVIFYREKRAVRYKDTHALNFRFKSTCTRQNADLNGFIQLSTNSILLNAQSIGNARFDENLSVFEDAKFINEILLQNPTAQSAFVKNALYFYRKRADKSSSIDGNNFDKNAHLKVAKIGTLSLLKRSQKNFIQNTALYHLFYKIAFLINAAERVDFTDFERDEYLKILDENFALISRENIEKFTLKGFEFWHRVGLLFCFKRQTPTQQMLFIRDFDDRKDAFLCSFFSGEEIFNDEKNFGGEKDFENFENFNSEKNFNNKKDSKKDGENGEKSVNLACFFGDKRAKFYHQKCVKYDFLGRIFCYEFRFWLCLKDLKGLNTAFSAFLNEKPLLINFKGEKFTALNTNLLQNECEILRKKRAKNANFWLFADSFSRADDNAEHLYRHLQRFYPEQKAYFAISKASKDYERLKKAGFKLVSPTNLRFLWLLKCADKVISSHIDRYIFGAFGAKTLQAKDFVFLQHGVLGNDVSSWLNARKIDLFITSTRAEFNSIAGLSRYKFSTKETALTGLPRHDSLLVRAKMAKNAKRQILIMPTWRKHLAGAFSKKLGHRRFNKDFYQSAYFRALSEFLKSDELHELCEKYDYTAVFCPHPNAREYFKADLPPHIKIAADDDLQGLFVEAFAMITDFSSVAFEMAYLGKSVLYYHFDEAEFFATQWQRGYFDYEKMGFGAVARNANELIAALRTLLENDCRPSKKYQKNIDNTFAFKDGKCCERVYRAICDLDSGEFA